MFEGISVVVPVYNEAEILTEAVGEILGALDRLPEGFELILIDDGSGDHTWHLIGRLAEADTRVRGVRLSRHFGKEQAICAGLDRARGPAVVVMDCDLQHPPYLIEEMVRVWRDKRVGIVEGVTQGHGRQPWLKGLGRRLFYAVMKHLSGYDLRGTSDFKLLDRRVVEALKSMAERQPFFRGMVAWVGFEKATVPFQVGERRVGSTKWPMTELAKYGMSNVFVFSALPLRIVNYIALVFVGFAVLLSALALYRYVAGEAFVGFTTVIILLLIIGSAILLGLGIIGEYVAKIHEEVKQRPRYLVADDWRCPPKA